VVPRYFGKMSHEFIQTGVAEGVLTITLNRPAVLNSFIRPMAHELQGALALAAADPTIRAVLLTGAGRAFCAGQDLTEALPGDDGVIPDIVTVVRECYNPIIRAIRVLEKPVVCAVNGVAAGAGANLALACDITIAADDAVFVEAFAKIGLIPDTSGTFFVPRLVGVQRATGMFFLGDKIPAAQAKEWGLIWDVAPRDQLLERATAMARTLAGGATRAFGLTKRALNASFTNTLDEQLEMEAQCMHQAGQTHDFREGVLAFVEKRAPRYTGS
jgi:2-(1,2-epoxy-1,2-dihydrophenyl)acetyl-CoA isomerase